MTDEREKAAHVAHDAMDGFIELYGVLDGICRIVEAAGPNDQGGLDVVFAVARAGARAAVAHRNRFDRISIGLPAEEVGS